MQWKSSNTIYRMHCLLHNQWWHWASSKIHFFLQSSFSRWPHSLQRQQKPSWASCANGQLLFLLHPFFIHQQRVDFLGSLKNCFSASVCLNLQTIPLRHFALNLQRGDELFEFLRGTTVANLGSESCSSSFVSKYLSYSDEARETMLVDRLREGESIDPYPDVGWLLEQMLEPRDLPFGVHSGPSIFALILPGPQASWRPQHGRVESGTERRRRETWLSLMPNRWSSVRNLSFRLRGNSSSNTPYRLLLATGISLLVPIRRCWSYST